MKGKLSRRILSTLLSLAMIISMLGITVIQVNATDDRIVTINIKGIIRRHSMAADLADEINARRQQLGGDYPLLTIDEDLQEQAMVRAAELPLMTEATDLCYVRYGGVSSDGYKHYESVIKSNKTVSEIVDALLKSSVYSPALTDKKVTDVGIGVISQDFDPDNYYVCIRSTNEMTGNACLFEVTPAELRAQADETVIQETKANADVLKLQDPEDTNETSVGVGETIPLLLQTKNVDFNGDYAYLVPEYSIADTSIVRGQDGSVMGLKPGTTEVGLQLLCDSSAPVVRYANITVLGDDFDNCTFEYPKEVTWRGTALTPSVKIIEPDGKVLVDGTDYYLSYSDNIHIGTGKITVTGLTNHYKRTKTLEFSINTVAGIDFYLSDTAAYPGDKVTVNLSGYNGVAPYRYELTVTDPTESSTMSSNTSGDFTVIPDKTGTYTLTAKITDADNVVTTSVKTVEVVEKPAVSFKKALYAGLKGSSVKVEIDSTGGLSPVKYTYEYEDGETVTPNTTNKYATLSLKTPGERKLFVYAADGKNTPAIASTTIVCYTALAFTANVSSSKVYLGDSTTITAVTTGGYAPFTYEFTDSEGNVLNSDGDTLVYTPEKTGSHVINIKVTDQAGTVKTNKATINVAAPLEVNLTCDNKDVLLGNSTTIKANVTGGFPTIKYKYEYLDGTSITGSSASLTYKPAAVGSYTIRVTVTDGFEGEDFDIITINAAPKLGVTLDLSTTILYTGYPVTLTAEGTGGFDPVSYQFEYADGTPIPSNGKTAVIIPEEPGTYTVQVNYLDKNTNMVTQKKTFTAVAPLDVNLKASQVRAVVGEQIKFTSETVGGYSTKTYKYTLDDGSEEEKAVSGTSSTTTYTPKATGDYKLKVKANDKLGISDESFAESEISFHVEPALKINATATTLYVNLGNETTLTAEAEGGYGPMTYYFTLADGTELGNGSGSAVFRPSEAGSYNVTCKAVDDAGHTVTKVLTIKAAEKLTVDLDSTLYEVVAGKTVTFTSTPHDGFPTIKYSYVVSDGTTETKLSGTSSKVTYTPSKEGDYKITVTATDLGGYTDQAETFITVAPKMELTVNVSDEAIFLGETAELEVIAKGGFPSYTFIYEYLNEDGSTTIIPSDPSDPCKASVSPDENGDYKVRVTFRDRNDNELTNTKIIRVTDKLVLSTSVSAEEVFVNDTVTFTAGYTGGFAPVTVSYSCDNSGKVTVSNGNGIFKPTKAGIYNVTITAKDKYSNIASVTYSIEVVQPLTLKLETESAFVNKGEPFTVKAVSTGGFPDIKYSFRFSGSDKLIDSSGNEAQLQLSDSGEYTIICQAADRKGNTVESVLTVNVCDPLKVAINATDNEVISGTKVTYTASSTGAYGNVTYKFTKNGSSMTSSNGKAELTVTTAGDYIIAVTATDDAGRKTTAETNLSVANKMTASAKVSASQVMVGDKVTVTTTAAGGFETLTYSYAYDDGREIPSNGTNVVEIPTTEAGTYNVVVTVKDRNQNTVTAKCTFKVIAEFEATLSAPSKDLVVGDSVVITTTATGGIPAYSYSYKYDDGTSISGTSSTLTFSPKQTGTYTIIATVKDKQPKTLTPSITFNVADKLTASLTASKNTVYTGENVTLTASSEGGYDNKTYQFAYEDDTPIASTGNKATFSNNVTGTYKVKVTVSDSKGHTAVAYQTIVVSTDLSVTLTPSATKAVAGTSIKLNTTIHGGFAPYTYKYEYADGTSISGTTASTSISPSKAGYYTVKVTVKDSTGDEGTATAEIEISNKLTVSFASTTAMVNIGDTYDIVANAAGGVDDLTYTFTYEDGTVLESKDNRAVFKPTEAGSTKINVKVEDTVGSKATASITISAAEKLSAALTVSDTDVVPGTTVKLNASATGGFAPLTYKFTATNGAKVSASGATGTCLLTLAGNTDFTVTVTDKAGKKATATCRVKVTSDLQTSFTASAYRIYVGDSITFTAQSTGGTAPVTFAFAYSDGTKITSSGNQAVIKPAESGSFTVVVTATDKYGNKATNQTKIIVDDASELFNTSTISSENIPLGSSVRLTGSCQGGSSPYKYEFYYKKARNSQWLKISTDQTECSLTPTAATNYDIKIVVTDRRNTAVEKTFSVKVDKELENTSTTNSDKVVVGQKIVITGSAVGGAGGYQYAFFYKKRLKSTWTVIGTEYTTKYASFRPGTATDYDVLVKVKDLDGTIKEKVIPLSGTIDLTNNSTVNAQTVLVGNKIVMKGLANGGTAPYKYAFYYKKHSKSAWNKVLEPYTTKSAAFRPGSAVSYDVKIVVKDDTDKEVEKVYTVNVTAELKDLTNDSTVNAQEIVLGDRIVLKGLASGGTAPYKYAFYYKKSKNTEWSTLGTEFTTESASFKPTAATSYDVKVITMDASGTKVEKIYTVNVNSAS